MTIAGLSTYDPISTKNLSRVNITTDEGSNQKYEVNVERWMR